MTAHSREGNFQLPFSPHDQEVEKSCHMIITSFVADNCPGLAYLSEALNSCPGSPGRAVLSVPSMTMRIFLVVAVLFGFIGGQNPALAAAKAKEPGVSSNEIQAKLNSNYVAVPPLRMAVQVDANRKYRSLELEVWLLQADPEKHQILNSKKKLIAEEMRSEFAGYQWEAFEDSANGPKVAKRIVADCVQRASGVPVEDVLIKELVLK